MFSGCLGIVEKNVGTGMPSHRDFAIVKGENPPQPGIPESFNVLVKELQSLGLDVQLEE